MTRVDKSNDRPLRVVLASWAPFVGGAEVAAERLAIGLRDDGHDVLVLLGRSGPVQERIKKAGLRCLIAQMRFTGKWDYPLYWLARRKLIRVLLQEQPDLVHSNDLPTHAMIADAARRAGIPRVCHHRFPFPRAAIDWMNKFGAERHLFVSKALMEEMTRESARLTAAVREVVYDGLVLPPETTPTERLEVRRRLGLPEDKVVVLFAGQIIERKGVADLIRAWMLMPAGARDAAELVVVGDDVAGGGAYRREMEDLAHQLGCPGRFVGFQKNVTEWLSASDVATVPSHAEPLGNATLEAMAAGLPVVGGDVGGIPEMVVDGRTGILVRPKAPDRLAAALVRLVADPAERRQMGTEGRARCQELFSLATHTRSVLAAYRAVLPGSTGAPLATA
jgi:glycosyltransferase involved in cell wall biosynthesis